MSRFQVSIQVGVVSADTRVRVDNEPLCKVWFDPQASRKDFYLTVNRVSRAAGRNSPPRILGFSAVYTTAAPPEVLQEVPDWSVFHTGLVALTNAGLQGHVGHVGQVLSHLPSGCCVATFDQQRNMATVLFGVYKLSSDHHPVLKSLFEDQLRDGGFIDSHTSIRRQSTLGSKSSWKLCLMNGHSFPTIMQAWFPWFLPDAFHDAVRFEHRLLNEKDAPVFSRHIPEPYKGVYIKIDSVTIRSEALVQAQWSTWFPRLHSQRKRGEHSIHFEAVFQGLACELFLHDSVQITKDAIIADFKQFLAGLGDREPKNVGGRDWLLPEVPIIALYHRAKTLYYARVGNWRQCCSKYRDGVQNNKTDKLCEYLREALENERNALHGFVASHQWACEDLQQDRALYLVRTYREILASQTHRNAAMCALSTPPEGRIAAPGEANADGTPPSLQPTQLLMGGTPPEADAGALTVVPSQPQSQPLGQPAPLPLPAGHPRLPLPAMPEGLPIPAGHPGMPPSVTTVMPPSVTTVTPTWQYASSLQPDTSEGGRQTIVGSQIGEALDGANRRAAALPDVGQPVQSASGLDASRVGHPSHGPRPSTSLLPSFHVSHLHSGLQRHSQGRAAPMTSDPGAVVTELAAGAGAKQGARAAELVMPGNTLAPIPSQAAAGGVADEVNSPFLATRRDASLTGGLAVQAPSRRRVNVDGSLVQYAPTHSQGEANAAGLHSEWARSTHSQPPARTLLPAPSRTVVSQAPLGRVSTLLASHRLPPAATLGAAQPADLPIAAGAYQGQAQPGWGGPASLQTLSEQQALPPTALHTCSQPPPLQPPTDMPPSMEQQQQQLPVTRPFHVEPLRPSTADRAPMLGAARPGKSKRNTHRPAAAATLAPRRVATQSGFSSSEESSGTQSPPHPTPRPSQRPTQTRRRRRLPSDSDSEEAPGEAAACTRRKRRARQPFTPN